MVWVVRGEVKSRSGVREGRGGVDDGFFARECEISSRG